MRFIDSNIIAYAFYDNPNSEKCQKILREEGITDTIVLIEAFNIIENEVSRKYALSSVRSILKSNIKIVNTDISLVFESLKRSEKSKLKFIDLIHYTTAVLSNCTEIVSYDKDFNGLDIKRIEP